jgi:hypothetical protein
LDCTETSVKSASEKCRELSLIRTRLDSLWKTFSSLTQADIDELKERLKKQEQDEWRQPGAKPEDDDTKTLN